MSLRALILICLGFGPSLATAATSQDFKTVMMLDALEMERFVAAQMLAVSKNSDDQAFAAKACEMAEMAFSHPKFTEREAGLREIRSRVGDEYPTILRRAAQELLAQAKSETPSEQATALVALTNLVIEARANQTDDYSDVMKMVAEANLEVSEEAQDFARYPLKKLISPSLEAKRSLGEPEEE
ncbi:MAG: hypothetical protein IT289_02615 [Oligoflexia bacterium]|nr:hypothetical protein [Oligoflexia bacterium]